MKIVQRRRPKRETYKLRSLRSYTSDAMFNLRLSLEILALRASLDHDKADRLQTMFRKSPQHTTNAEGDE